MGIFDPAGAAGSTIFASGGSLGSAIFSQGGSAGSALFTAGGAAGAPIFQNTGGAALDLLFTSGALDSRVTFSRSSAATQYTSGGLLAWSPSNMLTRSGDFTQSWGTITGTVTAVTGQTDPDGGQTAVKLTSTTAGDQWGLTPGGALLVGYQYVWSCWIRADSPLTVLVGIYDGVTVNSHAFAVTTSWARYQFAFAATGTSIRFQLFASPTTGTVAYFAKAQLEPSISGAAGDWISTTSAAYFGPRFTYDPATLTPLGLLIEESRTNLILQSNAFGTTWTLDANASLTSAAAVSPAGSSDAWKIAENSTTSAAHRVQQSFTKAASALSYAGSIFAKAVERTRITVQLVDSASNGASATFDLSGGQIGVAAAGFGTTPFTSVSASIQSVGNGWYRCALVATSTTDTTVKQMNFVDSGTGTGSQSTTYAGTVGSGVLIYGASLEQASFPTSYIPTTTASVTRAADVATVTIASTGLPSNPAGLTIIAKGTAASGAAGNQILAAVSDGTTSNRVQMGRTSSAGGFAFVATGGVTQANLASSSFANGATGALWTALQANDIAVQVVGGTKTTSASLTMPSGLTTVSIGSLNGGSPWIGTIARLQIYSSRLSDAQAAATAASL